MRRFSQFIGILALVLVGCSTLNQTSFNGIKGSGNLITEKRSVSDFHAVSASDSITLQLSQTGEETLSIEAEDNIMPQLTSEVADGTLKIGLKPNVSISTTRPMIFKLTVKNLDSIALHDAANATLGAITAGDKFSITSSDSASLKLDTVKAAAFELTTRSSGVLKANSLDNASAIKITA